MNKLKQQVAKIHLLVYFKIRLTFNSCIKLNQFNAFQFLFTFSYCLQTLSFKSSIIYYFLKKNWILNLIRYLSNKLEIKTKIIEEEMAVIGKWSMPLHSDRHSGQIPVAGDDTTEKTKALGWRISAFVNLNLKNTFFLKKQKWKP